MMTIAVGVCCTGRRSMDVKGDFSDHPVLFHSVEFCCIVLMERFVLLIIRSLME